MTRLAVLATHPIQYQAAWFRALAAAPKIDLDVFYCHKATPKEQAAAGFGVEFDWDMPLLDGYRYRFLNNISGGPSVRTFAGLNTPEIRSIIEREKYDTVVVNGWHYQSAWQAIRTCWRTKTPVMVRGDSHLHTRRSAWKRAGKFAFYRWFVSKLDACLPVGKWSREYFLHYGAQPERVFIVPHSVDDGYFSSEAARLFPNRFALRSQFGIPAETTVFLFAGKFIRKKRPMDFVNAIIAASKLGGNVHGLMVGDGPVRGLCEEATAKTRAPITFTGFMNQSEITRAYVAADALVLPSDGAETWGLVVNEAMLCRRPCLLSDMVGCAPDLIVAGKTGEVFRSGDVDELSALMSHYADQQSELTAMGIEAEQHVSKYSLRVAVDGLVNAVESVVRSKRREA